MRLSFQKHPEIKTLLKLFVKDYISIDKEYLDGLLTVLPTKGIKTGFYTMSYLTLVPLCSFY